MPDRNHFSVQGTESKSSNLTPVFFVCALLILEALVAAQFWLAARDQFLTVLQMQARGISQGLPIVYHFAMWSDLLLISPLVAFLIGKYWAEWLSWWGLAYSFIGFIASCLLHWAYTSSAILEAHVQNHHLTAVGFVHFVYMAIGFAVFVEFLFGSADRPPKLFAIVSGILVLHVFIGTHMLLGIWNYLRPLSWYGGEPLRSPLGWVSFGAVAVVLFWMNVPNITHYLIGRSSELQMRYPAIAPILTAGAFLTLQRANTIERYLKLLDFVADKIGPKIVISAYLIKLGIYGYLSSFLLGAKTKLTEVSVLPFVLLLLIAFIYKMARLSVKTELLYGPKLFSSKRFPKAWRELDDWGKVCAQVLIFLGAYLLMSWFVDNPLVVAFLLSLVAAIDLHTRLRIGDGIFALLSDKNYEPPSDDREYVAIQRRRGVAAEFLGKPHTAKEVGKFAGCAVAFALATYDYLNGRAQLDEFVYWILIMTLIVNEGVTFRWRYVMFCKMRAIDDSQS